MASKISLSRLLLLSLYLFLSVQAALSLPVSAQDYPTKTILFVVGGAVGGPNDIRAPQIGPKISDAFKQSVVENRPGASNSIAAEMVSHAPRWLHRVSRQLTLAELIDYAKAKPDALMCGNEGQGFNGHLGCAWFAKRAGIAIRHIGYKCVTYSLLDAASGQVHLVTGYAVAVDRQFTQPGKLIPLAVLGHFGSMVASHQHGHPNKRAILCERSARNRSACRMSLESRSSSNDSTA